MDDIYDFSNARFSAHAMEELARRRITVAEVVAVLSAPGQTIRVRLGRVVLQSLIRDHGGGSYVLRVFADIDMHPAVVVTAYRSSKIRKYWSGT